MQLYTLSQLSLAKGAGSSVTEMYIPLWAADGTSTAIGNTLAGNGFIVDGGLAMLTNQNPGNYTQTKLHTLNANWPATQKFAFEASIYTQGGGNTAYAQLWDITTNTGVANSILSTTSTTATVLRSSQFTLTAGHVYGVTIWSTNSSYNAYISDASLIVFP